MILPQTRSAQRRALQIVAAGAVAAALVGLMVETRRTPEPQGYSPPPERPAASHALEPAPRYENMGELRRQERRARHAAGLAAFRDQVPDRTKLTEATAEERSNTLKARAELRAFSGAPPVVPHPVDARGYPACSACHGEGAVIAGRAAKPMSHGMLRNCQQCHVSAGDSFDDRGHAGPPFENGFEGRAPAGNGPVAWTGAPPVVPHSTHMRERCDSCHGPLGDGLRTSHGGRQSCTQCHGISAELDRRPLLELPEVAP